MAVLVIGDTGSQVYRLQTQLAELKMFDPLKVARTADSATFDRSLESAVRSYQRANNLTVDGIVGPQTMGSLGWAVDSGGGGGSGGSGPTQGGSSGSAGDYTDAEATRFNGLPGQPEIWLDTGTNQAYVMYPAEGLEPPIPILWSVSQESDLSAYFGDATIRYDRKLTSDELAGVGAIKFGTTDNIPETEGNPWAGFLDRMERATEVQPWLADPEVFALFAGAWMEGRAAEQWELETTDYWQGLNGAQREWISLSARDPMSADRVSDDNYMRVYGMFRSIGVAEPPGELVGWIAQKFTHGTWSEAYLSEQIGVLTGLPGAVDLDAEMSTWMTDNSISVTEPILFQTDVKSAFDRWLGPQFAPSEGQLREWSAKLRANPQAAGDELTEHLRTQRLALFPKYEDDSLTYEDIASPWRSFMSQSWGQTVDETDPVFTQLIQMNDAVEGGKLLRKEGISRGVESVQTDVRQSIGRRGRPSRQVTPL